MGSRMRTKNWRMIIGGAFFAFIAAAFFVLMLGEAGHSTDPGGMMGTVGEVSFVVGGIGVALVIAGLLGWQGLSKKT
jgi:hypothetical protein